MIKNTMCYPRLEIQIGAVCDALYRRQYVCRGSDGAILPGRQSDEMASGPYHLVLRDFRAASFPSRTTSPFAKSFVGCSTAITTRSARRFRRRSCALPFPVRRSMRFSRFAHMWTKRWKGSSQATFMTKPARRIILGLNHEQQHQELALTDIKHAFFSNPLRPAYVAPPRGRERISPSRTHVAPLQWRSDRDWLSASTRRTLSTFAFDNETPRHKVYLEPFQIANREVTCREYLEFMSDDVYARPEFWLSEGWETVKPQGWQAPLYWERDATDETGWRIFTLGVGIGLSALLDTPVCHVVSLRPMRLHAGEVAGSQPKRNGNRVASRSAAARKSARHREAASRKGARRGR